MTVHLIEWCFDLYCGTEDNAGAIKTAFQFVSLYGKIFSGVELVPIGPVKPGQLVLPPNDLSAAIIADAVALSDSMDLFNSDMGNCWFAPGASANTVIPERLRFTCLGIEGNAGGLAQLLQSVQRKIAELPECVFLEVAMRSDVPEPGAFGGAIYRITKEKIDYRQTLSILSEDSMLPQQNEEQPLPVNVLLQHSDKTRKSVRVDVGVQGPGGQMVVRSEEVSVIEGQPQNKEIAMYASQLAYCTRGTLQIDEDGEKLVLSLNKGRNKTLQQAMPSTVRVWFLVIRSSTETTVSLHESEDSAKAMLADYCKSQWGG